METTAQVGRYRREAKRVRQIAPPRRERRDQAELLNVARQFDDVADALESQ
jgi:hypothetical protein